MRFNEDDYQIIYDLTFGTEGYPGYKPEVQEAPNGDGNWDVEKRYAHVATKYSPCPELMTYFAKAFEEACRVHKGLGFPDHLKPDWDSCCMRILDYPPGAGSAKHTDFDFFTIQLYRDNDHLGNFIRDGVVKITDEMLSIGIHFGEMAEIVGLREAMPHYIKGSDTRQKSIVFFVLPNPAAALVVAGDWLAERVSRSRR